MSVRTKEVVLLDHSQVMYLMPRENEGENPIDEVVAREVLPRRTQAARSASARRGRLSWHRNVTGHRGGSGRREAVRC